jgi:hypothetical protein
MCSHTHAHLHTRVQQLADALKANFLKSRFTMPLYIYQGADASSGGSTVGSTVVSTVGGTIGGTVGGTVGSTVGGTVGSTVGGTVGSTVGGTVGSTVGGTVACFHTSVLDLVGARGVALPFPLARRI